MAHTSEKRWSEVSGQASSLAESVVSILNLGEEAYNQMLEIYTYAGGNAEGLANLLFKETIENRTSPDNVPNAEELAKATDIVAAMTAIHQLYQAANNVAVTQSDRLTPLRRMI